MILARSQFVPRRAAVVLGGGAAALAISRFALPVRAQEDQEEPTTHAEEKEESPVVSQQQWEEVWEEDKGTFLRPYITSVRVAAQDTAADAFAQWDSFKKKTDLDTKWDKTKHHATRYYWLITGHKLGPEIAFAATAGILTVAVTRKALRLPFRLALLSGGLTTAALLPPYAETVPYLTHQYETFEWAKVVALKDKFDPVAIKDVVVDEIKDALPFGLGKKTPKNVAEELHEEKKEKEDVGPVVEEEHHTSGKKDHHPKEVEKKACCHDDGVKEVGHHPEHHHKEEEDVQ